MKFNLKRFIFSITGLILLSCNNDEIEQNGSDLSIVVEASTTTPIVGNNLIFTLTATNNGPIDATAVLVTNKILSGYTFNSFEASSGKYNSETGIWTIDNLKNQAIVTLNIVVTVNPTGDYNNKASISGGQKDVTETNNSANFVFTKNPLGAETLFNYNIITEGDNKFVSITGLSKIWEGLSGEGKSDIRVPSELFGYPVKVIGKSAFSSKTELLNVFLPNSITRIDSEAFQYCSKLVNVTISNNLVSIGEYAFANCRSIKTIMLPDSVTTIARNVFSNCTSLTKINIPKNVKMIGYDIFSDCSSLTDFTIHDFVEIIGDGAFRGCSSLKSITIPNSVKTIGDGAFEDCLALTSLTVAQSNQFFIEDNDVLYDKKYQKILLCLVKKSGSFSIPDSVNQIGWAAFKNCKNLTDIIISDRVYDIKSWAFYGCESLTEVIVPSNVRTIGLYCFSYNTNLKTVIMNPIIPPALYSELLFNGSTNLTAIKVPVNSVEAYKAAKGFMEYENIIVAQ